MFRLSMPPLSKILRPSLRSPPVERWGFGVVKFLSSLAVVPKLVNLLTFYRSTLFHSLKPSPGYRAKLTFYLWLLCLSHGGRGWGGQPVVSAASIPSMRCKLVIQAALTTAYVLRPPNPPQNLAAWCGSKAATYWFVQPFRLVCVVAT